MSVRVWSYLDPLSSPLDRGPPREHRPRDRMIDLVGLIRCHTAIRICSGCTAYFKTLRTGSRSEWRTPTEALDMNVLALRHRARKSSTLALRSGGIKTMQRITWNFSGVALLRAVEPVSVAMS